MGHFIVADLDVKKYNIYHIKKDEGLYSETFYHDLVQLMREQTGHNIVGSLQTNSMNNVSFPDELIQEEKYFEPFYSQIWCKYVK